MSKIIVRQEEPVRRGKLLLHRLDNLPTKDRHEEGERSIHLERIPGGWQITITHPQYAIHHDGSRSEQAPEVFRCNTAKQAWDRYVVYAQTLGGEIELAEDGLGVVEREDGTFSDDDDELAELQRLADEEKKATKRTKKLRS